MHKPDILSAENSATGGIDSKSIRTRIGLRRNFWDTTLYAGLLAGIDCGAIFLAFFVAYFLRSSVFVHLDPQLNRFVPLEPFVETSWMILLWPAVFFYDGLYERGLGNWDEQIRLLKGVCFAGLVAMGATYVFHAGSEYSRSVLIGTCLAATLTIPAMRAYFKARFLPQLFPIRVLILSSKLTEQKVTSEDPLLTQLGYKILEVVVVDVDQEELTLRDSIHRKTARLGADEIIVDGRDLDEEAFRRLLRCAESAGVRVKVLPDFSTFQLRASVRNLDGLILFDLNSGLTRPISRLVKRMLDLSVAAILLILFTPLFVLLGVLIKLDSSGPAFFRHRRLDSRGQDFYCWKFRTMYTDAEERLRHWMKTDDSQAREFLSNFKLREDPRVTRIGRVLRRTSLDELPQLLNVVLGQMSLVGPRPIVPEEVSKYGYDVQYLRMAKGGMTGMWQVSGRNNLVYSQRVALDLYYVRNWSIWLDIVILVKTCLVLVTRVGAY
jgi:Undecaprenyl-phosphate galactose phosphotransferase WbaP